MNEDNFKFNKKLVQTINMFWLKRGINAGARLKKHMLPDGEIYYTIVSNLIVEKDYTVDVRREN
jgi:hypothetical protein|tara:strand:+ start:440 stop:631 length:192 start_codon:yes stop_codon:yes gene_type:complete